MANIVETKVIIGGMDSDNAVEHIRPEDFLKAHNFRPTGTDSQDGGYGNNIESTVEIVASYPIGINKTIGKASFETLRKLYYVNYNSNGRHQLRYIDYDSKTSHKVFENITDSGGKDLLDLNPQSYFTDIRLLQDRWLIMTDGFGEVYSFDLNVFNRESYDRPILIDDITLIKPQPLEVPTASYGDDTNYTVNNLRGKLFQFRSQYKYSGNMYSSWGTISKRPIPTNEGSSVLGQTVTRDNYIKVDVKLGTTSVENLLVSMRFNDSEWVIVKDLAISYIKGLQYNTIELGRNNESYNITTNTYSFLFYNDGAYTPVESNETDLPYDAVPKKANTVEIVNGNVVALGGITEGYDRPTDVDVIITSSDYLINIGTNVTGGGNFDVDWTKQDIWFEGLPSATIGYKIEVHFKGTPVVGDTIIIVLQKKTNIAVIQRIEHVVASDEAGNLNLLYNRLASKLPRGVAKPWGVEFRTDVSNQGRDSFELQSASVKRTNIGAIDSKSYNVLKSGSSYQLALAHIDNKGRYFPIVTDERFKVQTTPFAQSQGLTPQINWTINSKPPIGAVAYQWVMTENLKYQNFVYLTAKYDEAKSAQGDYIVFEVSSLARFIDANKGVISYQFTEGDRASLIYTTNGTVNTPIKWFRFPPVDVDIISFDIEIESEIPKYYLKLRKSSNLNVLDVTGKETLIELYTPRPKGDEKNSLFFEVGEQYNIVNGEYSVTSGSIKEGDTFLKGRLYESTITPNTAIPYVIEDPNFSDGYKSKFYSFGRVRSYYDEISEQFRKGSLRFSDVSVMGSNYNGTNRFYLGRIYGEGAGETTSKYGAITKLQMRDNYLVCIQELKVGHIPVYNSIIEDNDGQLQLADSAILFNKVRYLPGNFGTGTAKNSVCISKVGNIYFVDDNNCIIVRDGYDGIRNLNGTMNKWFNERIKRAKAEGDRIISYYNDFYDELNITINTIEGELYNFPFNTKDWKYKDSFSVQPDELTYTNVVGGILSWDAPPTGAVTFTPNSGFVGMGGFEVNFNGITKHVCVNVNQSDLVPDQFTFLDRTGVQQDVWIESNSITVSGITGRSPLTIIGGEVNVDDGGWHNAPITVANGAIIRVRVKSANAITTTTSTTLTIGGVSDTFSVTTSATDIKGDTIVTYGYIPRVPQSGPTNYYKAKAIISIPIEDDITVRYTLTYRRNGQWVEVPVIVNITAGDTSGESASWNITDSDPVDETLIVSRYTMVSPLETTLVKAYGTTDEYNLLYYGDAELS